MKVPSSIESLANSQHRVVDREQLNELGVDDVELNRLAMHGALHWIYDDVLCLDADFTWLARCKGATLQHPGGVISHMTAAMLYGLEPIDESLPIQITIPE